MTTKRTTKNAPADAGAAVLVSSLSDRPEGYRTVWAIIRAFDDGQPIPDKELMALVDALRAFTANCSTDDALQEFGRRLNLRGKKGRHTPTVAEASRRIEVALFVLHRERELVATGIATKTARTAACREASDQYHRSERSVQRDLRELGDISRTYIYIGDSVRKIVEEQARIANMFATETRNRADKS